ncbi:MAG: hypothetical protein PWR02_1302 [Synergistales bacterium]|nr:hypothetical protein [Synergistales bacterium]MDN5336276.1 hypothetical protein [Synergistales bacterium]
MSSWGQTYTFDYFRFPANLSRPFLKPLSLSIMFVNLPEERFPPGLDILADGRTLPFGKVLPLLFLHLHQLVKSVGLTPTPFPCGKISSTHNC